MKRQRITPSLVISVVALIVALGGVSYAAIQIPRNSVGPAQLKKNSVDTVKVKNRTLLRNDFRPGQLPGAAWIAERNTDGGLLAVNEPAEPVVTTRRLPAGSYVLAGRANVIGGGGVQSRLICSMASDAAQNFTVGNAEMLPLSMAATVQLARPGRVSLNCSKSAGAPAISQAWIIATRVSRITGTAG